MKIKFILIVIIVLGALLRLYMLSSVPAGITSDEAGTSYDAYSILLTGRDQWGTNYPLVSFRGFGDYRMGLYTYVVSAAIKLFGLTEFAVRLPSAIAGILSVFFIFLLGRKLFDEHVGLFAAFLLAVSPWAGGISRQGIESNLAMTFYIVALFLFLKIKEGKQYLALSILFFALSMYTYTSYIILAPLTVLALCIIYRKVFLKISRQAYVIFALFITSILPIVFSASAGNKRVSQIGFLSDITSLGIIDVLNLKIGSCYAGLPSFLCRILYNKPFTFLSVFATNYLHHFSLDFLYLHGTTTQFSILPERGLLYSYEIIFLLFGIFYLFKNKKNIFIVFFLLLSAIPDSLSGGGHHSRSLAMLPFIILIEGAGLFFIVKLVYGLKKQYKYIFISAISTVIIFSVASFITSYFTYFKTQYSSYSLYAYKELSKNLPVLSNHYKNIYITNYLNDEPQYIFYLFYNKYDPAKFQKKEGISYAMDNTGFIKIKNLGNIHFTDFRMQNGISDEYKNSKNAIFIGSPDAFPKNTKALISFKSLSGGVIFQAVKYNELKKR